MKTNRCTHCGEVIRDNNFWKKIEKTPYIKVLEDTIGFLEHRARLNDQLNAKEKYEATMREARKLKEQLEQLEDGE